MSLNINLLAYIVIYCLSAAFLLFCISNLLKKVKRSQYELLNSLFQKINNIHLENEKQIEKQINYLNDSFEKTRENQNKIIEQLRDFNKFIELSCQQIEISNTQFDTRKELEKEIIKLKKILERRRKKDG